MKNLSEHSLGVIYAAFAYFLWGLLPIYWKLLDHVSADEILANRVFWSFLFMLVILVFTQKWAEFTRTLRQFKANKRVLLALVGASVLISINWYLYIWAVNSNHMVEASLGYYINPLVSVLLGVLFLKERLSLAQYISFLLALIGVLILTFSYGVFPWVSIVLALSFGLYGLTKKLIKVDSSIGLTLETMVVAPIAAFYLGKLFINGTSSFVGVSWSTTFLLAGAGAATALPLLYFAKGAQRIPLSMVGFLQYIAPTLTLILGIFVYHESFSKIHLLSFMFIWAALTLYTISKSKLPDAWLLWKGKKAKSFDM